LPVDLLEFFYLTPLPGSEDHLKLFRVGAPLDPDLNKYDLNHVCMAHPRMTKEEWERAYKLAWQRYYTFEHMETVLRRVASVGGNASNALFLMTWFKGSIDFETPPRGRLSAAKVSPRSASGPVNRADVAVLSSLLF
jgi:hypothetical protein